MGKIARRKITEYKDGWTYLASIVGKGKDGRPTYRSTNPYKVVGDITYVQTRDANENVTSIFTIDTEDIERVIYCGSWQVQVNSERYSVICGWYYPEGPTRRRTVLSRLLMDCLDCESVVDHINRNALDNRKCNLRLCNSSENHCNRRAGNGRKYKGIAFRPAGYGSKVGVLGARRDMWFVYIRYKGRREYLGTYCTEESAARAYDRRAIELHGEFACTNFPRSDYEKESL